MLSEIDVDLQSFRDLRRAGVGEDLAVEGSPPPVARRQHASSDGFNLEDVAAGKYGHSIHFWDLEARRVTQTIDLGQSGMIPLEIR